MGHNDNDGTNTNAQVGFQPKEGEWAFCLIII
jgi:hypothetical protein